MRIQFKKSLIVAAMLFSASLAQAAAYTYEIQQDWSYTYDATTFGSLAKLLVTVDNGGSTNQGQTYSWADITGLELRTNGTFSAVWDWATHSLDVNDPYSVTDTLFTTDATGNQANFQLWNGEHGIFSQSGPVILQFATSNGGSGLRNLWAYDGRIQRGASIHPWPENLVGTLVNNIPEPSSIALLAAGLLGFGLPCKAKKSS